MRLEGTRHRVRVIKARWREAVGVVLLLRAAARGRVQEIWVGDSHAVTFITGLPPLPGILRADNRRWIYHVGPRLMYSIAREGLPRRLHHIARRVARSAGGQDVTWIFSFGEIDIRCHLGPRVASGSGVGFVADYVEHVRSLLEYAGIASGTVVVPVPPSKDTFDHVAFPVAGSVSERLAAHAAVRAALRDATVATRLPVVRILDLTDRLAEPSGLLDPPLTDDGCHTNDAGRERVSHAVDAHLRSRPDRPEMS